MTNIHEEFFKRCLYKSLNFLENIGIKSNDYVINHKEQILTSYFNQRSYIEISKSVCNFECSCCNPRMQFLSLYSEYIHQKIHFGQPNLNLVEKITQIESNDPYFLFMKALVSKEHSIHLLLEALKQENFLFDAFESLLFLVNDKEFLEVEEIIENNIDNFLVKRIYIIYFYVLRFKKPLNLKKYVIEILNYYDLNYLVNNGKKLKNEIGYSESDLKCINKSKKYLKAKATPYIYSLIGAYFYTTKDYKTSKIFFEENLKHDLFCFEFLDMYSHIFYIENKLPELAIFAQKLTKANRYKPETLMAIANYYSAKKYHDTAIEYLKKSAKVDERFLSSYTLVGHEYFEKKLYNMALECYLFSLKINKEDYRAYFGIGQVKFQSGSLLESEHYFKRAVELQNDNGFFWLTYGIVLEKLNKYEDAQQAYIRSKDEGEVDGYLRLADLFKKMKRYSESINAYIKYVEECKKISKPCKKIANLLGEYFSKKGDSEKANHFFMLYEK